MDKNVAINKLKKIRERALDLTALRRESPEFAKWHRDTEIAIEKIFGEDARNIKDFKNITYWLSSFSSSTTESEYQARYEEGLNEAAAILQSMIDEIDEYWVGLETKPDVITKRRKPTNKIFIVHGRDEEMKLSVARLLEKLHLIPIILHEQPNKGRTIIQKFLDYSDVRFAVILLSPDDYAYSKDKNQEQRKLRARQNVVLELGFFLGKLGPERVASLFREHEDFEIPSDYDGVIYIPFDDSGSWQYKLAKELKACEFVIDLNKI